MEEAEVSGEAIGRIRGVVQNSGELPLVWFGLDARQPGWTKSTCLVVISCADGIVASVWRNI